MSGQRVPYPVVDLFAGPGGLGEGFSSFLGGNGTRKFESVAAIERDEYSHQTLLLRHFFRQFPEGKLPYDYYRYLKGEISCGELYRRYPAESRAANAATLRISLGPESHAQVRRIISEKVSRRRCWVLVGGPPCQAYSLVGRSRMKGGADFERDERHTLYLEYLKIITDHRPPVFVMENVKGLLSATIEGKSTITQIVRDLANPKSAVQRRSNGLSYRLYSLSERARPGGEVDPRLFLVRAENYGVPQARHRMFIVGIRSDLNIRPALLTPQRAPTVRQTIGGLPPIRSRVSNGPDSLETWQREVSQLGSMNIRSQLDGVPYAERLAAAIGPDAISGLDWPPDTSSRRYQMSGLGRHQTLRFLRDPRLHVLTGHEARGHMASDLRRYLYAAVFAQTVGTSPRLADFPKALLPAHQNVELGKTGKMFSDRFRVQLPDQVATTVTSHISKDGHYFIHYDPAQCRSLTVREAARLQTFPDNYHFEGPRTAQYHQVGNAVPPYLAQQIAESIARVLDSIRDAR